MWGSSEPAECRRIPRTGFACQQDRIRNAIRPCVYFRRFCPADGILERSSLAGPDDVRHAIGVGSERRDPASPGAARRFVSEGKVMASIRAQAPLSRRSEIGEISLHDRGSTR